MWFGHIVAGLIVAVLFGFDLTVIALAVFFSWLPNIDAFFVKLGFQTKEFHDGPTHSLGFAAVIGMLAGLIDPVYGLIAFLAIILHCLSDMPTDAGILFFYPLSKKNVSLNLWKETGFWGFSSIKGYYAQKWAIISESLSVIILIVLLLQFSVI